jgi:hypothetical protein
MGDILNDAVMILIAYMNINISVNTVDLFFWQFVNLAADFLNFINVYFVSTSDAELKKTLRWV